MEQIGDFLMDSLIEYIQMELTHGYSFEDIKEVCLQYHEHDIVEAAIDHLRKKRFSTNIRKRKHQKLEEGMFYYVVNSLVEYIKRQKKRGYQPEAIRKALINYGHSKQTVESALNAVEHGIEPKFVKALDYEKFQRIFFPLALASYVIFVVLASIFTNQNFVKVVILFSPLLLTMVLVRMQCATLQKKYTLLIAPVILSVVFYVIGTAKVPFFDNIEVGYITGFNLLFGVVFTLLYIGVEPEVVLSSMKEMNEKFEKQGNLRPAELKKTI